MKEVSRSEKTVSNEVLKKSVSVFSKKWGSSENNTGGILIDGKRKVTGFFLFSEGHVFLFTTAVELQYQRP